MSQLDLSGADAAIRLNSFFPTHVRTSILAVDFTLSKIGLLSSNFIFRNVR